ncbi:MAG: hypothetical protein ABEJ97_02085 [Halobellus sp.]
MSDAPQGREVARRVFAAEFDDATLSYSESDEERAPNYVVTPTGARINRLFAVGALTEVEQVNDEIVRGRIADPTGVFVSYAGQYQPDAMAFLERATPPCFVSLTGKARTYQPEDSDRIFTSVRPESLNEVDADTRDRWVVAAADATLDRVATMAAALDLDVRGDDLRAALESRGVDAALAQGVALAIDHYDPTEHYLEAVRTMAIQGLELVADEREAVDTLAVAPDESGPDELGPLPEVAAASAAPAEATGSETSAAGSESASADVEPTPTESTEAAEAPETTESAEPAESTGSTVEPDVSEGPDGLGDFDVDADAGESGAGVDESEMYELDPEERAEIEAEYGTEFETGNEVGDPGEADIDVPDADELEAEAGEATASEPEAAEPEPTADDSESADAAETDAANVDLEDAAVAVMEDLDDGDGADREAVIAAVVEEYGADPDDVEDAIQEALMSGQCYEPAEGTLKAI